MVADVHVDFTMMQMPLLRKNHAYFQDRARPQHFFDLQEPRFYLLLLGIFGATALILAAVGIYGVMAYSVKMRTHEIGVRMALGAHQKDVMWMILRQGLTLTFLGVAAGIGGALWLTRFIAGVLYGVQPTDPVTFTIVALTMIGVAVLACLVPGRRATNVDPAIALRHE